MSKKNILKYLCISSLAVAFTPFIINAASVNNNNNEKIKLIKYKNYIQELTGTRPSNIEVYKMNDLKGSKYFLVKSNGSGLYIFNNDDVCLEYMPNFKKKIDIKSSDSLYYFGHLNYYLKKDKTFIHMINKDIISIDEASFLQKSLDEMNDHLHLMNKNNDLNLNEVSKMKSGNHLFSNNNSYSSWIGDEKMIKGYEYLVNPIYPENTEGTCGYISAMLLLWWWHKTNSYPIISDKFLDDNGVLKTSGFTLHDELVSIGVDLGFGYSTDAIKIRDVIVKYAEKYNYNLTAWWFIANYKVWEEIDNGYPVICFAAIYGNGSKNKYTGELDHNSADSKRRHSVLIYGYNSKYYICNYGWNLGEKTYLINLSWWSNTQVRFDY